jgi:hypothetical protein
MKSQGFVPVLNPSGKSQRTGSCPHCGSTSAAIFKAEAQEGVYASCCIRCKKRAVRPAKAQAEGPAEPRTITEDTVPTNPITAAAKGMVLGARALKTRCQGTNGKGKPCACMALEGKKLCRHHLGQDNLGY